MMSLSTPAALPSPALLPVHAVSAWQRAGLTVALLAVVTLLAALVLVAQEGMRTGEPRRAAVAAHANAVWRCAVIARAPQRDACLHALDAAPALASGV